MIPLGYFNGEVNDARDEWIYAIKNQEVLDEFTSKGMGAMKQKMDYLTMTVQDQREYRSYMEQVGSAKGTILDAQRKGVREGLEQGREERRVEVEEAQREKEEERRQKEEALKEIEALRARLKGK